MLSQRRVCLLLPLTLHCKKSVVQSLGVRQRRRARKILLPRQRLHLTGLGATSLELPYKIR